MSCAKSKSWLESRWRVSPDRIENFQTKIEQMGSLGFYENIDLKQNAHNAAQNSEIIAFFPDQKSIDQFAKKLKTLEDKNTHIIIIKRIPESDWATAWKKYFKPFKLTPGIIIRPSWEKYKKKKNETVIVLDPGMAFGTGLHDTTKFCAAFICALKKKNPRLKSLLDIGCGSGILSLVARTVGFEKVVGIDTDPEAIEASHENRGRNPDLEPISFHQTQGSLDYPSMQGADVVAANIIAETLCELKNDLTRLTNNNGFLILSGILPERADLVREGFKELDLVETKISPEWHAYVYRKK